LQHQSILEKSLESDSENVIPGQANDNIDKAAADDNDAEFNTGPDQFPSVNDMGNDDGDDVDGDVGDIQAIEAEAENSVECPDDGEFSLKCNLP